MYMYVHVIIAKAIVNAKARQVLTFRLIVLNNSLII